MNNGKWWSYPNCRCLHHLTCYLFMMQYAPVDAHDVSCLVCEECLAVSGGRGKQICGRSVFIALAFRVASGNTRVII